LLQCTWSAFGTKQTSIDSHSLAEKPIAADPWVVSSLLQKSIRLDAIAPAQRSEPESAAISNPLSLLISAAIKSTVLGLAVLAFGRDCDPP
jgi:hypothetical protein